MTIDIVFRSKGAKINLKIRDKAEVTRTANLYTARCMVWHVIAHGDSASKAMKNLKKKLKSYIVSLYSSGQLTTEMRKRNLKAML